MTSAAAALFPRIGNVDWGHWVEVVCIGMVTNEVDSPHADDQEQGRNGAGDCAGHDGLPSILADDRPLTPELFALS